MSTPNLIFRHKHVLTDRHSRASSLARSGMLLAPFLFFLFSRANSGPQIDCFIDLQECDIREDNLISTFLGIPSTEECQHLCEDELTCTAFTHFGSNSHPIPDSCLLFSACKERRACQSCTTGSSQTECTCSISYAGDVTPDNFVGLVPSVQDELACKELRQPLPPLRLL